MDTNATIAEIRESLSLQCVGRSYRGGYVIARETPRSRPDDEELLDSKLTEFGSACIHLPSGSPQQLQQYLK